MVSSLGRILLVGCAGMAVQPLLGKLPYLGWFLTSWPVTWGFWIYLASQVAREGHEHLRGSPNPRIPVMTYSAVVGGVTGLAGATALIALDLTLASVAASAGPAGSLAGLGYAVGAGFGLIKLFTCPFWGILVCGAAGLFLGGSLVVKHSES